MYGVALICVTIGALSPELRIELQPAVIAKMHDAIITDARGAVISAGVVHPANQDTVFWFGNIIVKLLLAAISHGRMGRQSCRQIIGTLLDRRAAIKNLDG